MGNLKKYKIIAFCTLFVQLFVCFILFSQIQNLSVLHHVDGNKTFIYLMLVINICISLVLFILIILLSKKNESIDLKFENKIDIFEDKQKSENDSFEKNAEEIDIEHYLKKIIPKDDSKMNMQKFSEKILSNFAKEFDIVQGLFFIKEKKSNEFSISGKYAYFGETEPENFKTGETLSGQVAKNMKILYLSEIPENYVTILSGLGSSSPNQLIIIPVISNNETIAIIELASFKEFNKSTQKIVEAVSFKIGETLTNFNK